MKPFFYGIKMLLLSGVFIVGASSLKNASSKNLDCDDYKFVFVRGSGQSLEDSDYRSFKEKTEAKIKDLNIKYSFEDLDYPAVSVSNFNTLLGTYISAGDSYEFGKSVEKGIKNLKNLLSSERKACKDKKFILAGYSQGAMVITKTLPTINSSQIFYAATFGDPKLYLPEGKNACKNKNLSEYRVHVPDCDVEEGILDGQKPYQPFGFSKKVGAWCNQNDIMCGSDLNIINPIGAHLAYKNTPEGHEKFAELIAEKIKQPSRKANVNSDANSKNSSKTNFRNGETPTTSRNLADQFLKNGFEFLSNRVSNNLNQSQKPQGSIRGFQNSFGQNAPSQSAPSGQKSSLESDVVKNTTITKDIVVLYDVETLADYMGLYIKVINSELEARLKNEVENGARVSIYNIQSTVYGNGALSPRIPWTTTGLSEAIFKYNTEGAWYPKNKSMLSHSGISASIKEAAEKLDWTEDADKTILVMSDKIYTNFDSIDGTTNLDALAAAKKKGIKVSFMGGFTNEYRCKISRETGGSCVIDRGALKNSENLILNKRKAPAKLSKIFQKTYGLDSAYTVVIVNGVVYGMTNKNKITIGNLDEDRENEIILISYDKTGKRLKQKVDRPTFSNIPLAPDCSD